MENRRTETARDHDDKDIIDNADEAPDKVGRAGGGLSRDVGTQDEAERVEKPDTHNRATKQDDIRNDAAYPSDRGRRT
ncbi:hypothetical protein [Stakelama saccharophila]|uniref:Uncharacterized protein n=1 Tax=Stakelama saccharophila TaxID=3075605 RepID=A0ABZ0B7P0_9SPHN|nr:hypothetical protein [Stakelama sp. W311]WNO52883.1 hypothetical protein RPR59_10485 [Stakelama sp. W311]